MRWKQDAREYGRMVRKGGWWLAYLAARRVVEGSGNGVPLTGPTAKGGATAPPSEDAVCSLRAFAAEAGTSKDRVKRHLEAWDRAATAGVVPPRRSFVGTEHNVPMPDEEDQPFDGFDTAVASVAPHIKDGRRADIIAAANAAGVGASKALDVAQNRKAVIAAVTGDPELAKAIAADAGALLAVQRAENLARTADAGPRPRPQPEREPLTVSDGLILIGANAELRGVLDRATAAAADGKGYAPEMREAMLLGLDETITLATALRDVLTGRLGQPVTDEALAALLDGGR
jgi:hypothetical protein